MVLFIIKLLNIESRAFIVCYESRKRELKTKRKNQYMSVGAIRVKLFIINRVVVVYYKSKVSAKESI